MDLEFNFQLLDVLLALKTETPEQGCSIDGGASLDLANSAAIFPDEVELTGSVLCDE
jgi:hypothetical protein